MALKVNLLKCVGIGRTSFYEDLGGIVRLPRSVASNGRYKYVHAPEGGTDTLFVFIRDFKNFDLALWGTGDGIASIISYRSSNDVQFGEVSVANRFDKYG